MPTPISEQMEATNLFELEMKARELLPKVPYDYCAGGANDESTLRENHVAYERITLLPRMLVDVSARNPGKVAGERAKQWTQEILRGS
jgi:isopentenyl diphosphate isomerase/L-lactate dehydrogenase-like FMN-dependent dehydrogenase